MIVEITGFNELARPLIKAVDPCATLFGIINGPLMTTLRGAGMTLSPFNAWVVLKGMETLYLRMKAQSDAALAVARWLEAHPAVSRVYYPGLASHPQHELALRRLTLKGEWVSRDRIRIG